MLDKLLNTPAMLTARGALTGMAARHAALADNLANVNTPGYKRKEVPFETALSGAVQARLRASDRGTGTEERPFRPVVARDTLTMGREDGNNVDVERELVQLTDNATRYQTVTQCVSMMFSGLKLVINGGR